MKRSANPDDAPELDAEFFERAQPIADGAAALSRAIKATAERKVRGKQKAPTKQLVSLRLDAAVIETYRRTGKGWQTRIAADLERAAKRRKKHAAA